MNWNEKKMELRCLDDVEQRVWAATFAAVFQYDYNKNNHASTLADRAVLDLRKCRHDPLQPPEGEKQ